MLGIRRIKLFNKPLTPVVVNELVDTKEQIPAPPKKVRVLPLVFLGLGISIVVAGIGFLIWILIQNSNKPDLVVNAPSVLYPSATPIPTPTDGTVKLVSQDILFETEEYRNELAGFEIKVPKFWNVDESGQSGAIVVLLDPKTTKTEDGSLLTFVNVTTGPSGDTLENEVLTAKLGLQKLFDSYEFEEDKTMTVSGKTYHLLGGSYLIKGTKMRNRNLILMYNNRGYAISATAPDSVWSAKEMLLNATLFSFKNF